jgi:hypothetical protein
LFVDHTQTGVPTSKLPAVHLSTLKITQATISFQLPGKISDRERERERENEIDSCLPAILSSHPRKNHLYYYPYPESLALVVRVEYISKCKTECGDTVPTSHSFINYLLVGWPD